MHEGKIVEAGTHEELLNLNGRYNSLWQRQTTEFTAV
jgi:ABC-type multidrug transport system fused ATPase/permease subunit